VNGEKYEFSQEVIELGTKLFQCFLELQRVMRKSFLSSNYEHTQHFNSIRDEMVEVFEAFDVSWASYEELYVKELMSIEQQARKYITDAIDTEKRLTELEQNANGDLFKRVDDAVDKCREELAHQFAKLNSVANIEGHGRDDLSYEIMRAADRMLKEVSSCESESIRKLAKNVKATFESLRELLRKYNENIEVVDPQLRNNQELVNELVKYEKSWEKGKIYFLDRKRCNQLIYFSNVLEGLSEKYETFKDQLDSYEAEVFVIIPMIMVLRKVDGEDRGICEHFLPQLSEKSDPMSQEYAKIKNTLFELNERILSSCLKTKAETNRKSFLDASLLNASGMKTLLKSQKSFGIAQNHKFKKLASDLYNTMEKIIINDSDMDKCLKANGLTGEKTDILNCLKIMKSLSIELQRQNPTDWNEFLDIALDNKQATS